MQDGVRVEPQAARLGRLGAWGGFMAAAVCVVGMIGLVGTYSAPLPYEREARREAVLDQVAMTPAPQREALRDGPIGPRVAAERAAMRVRFAAEADATAQSLRLLIVVVTLMGAVFGGLALGLQRQG
jgi:hypothetical protein